MGVQEIGTRPEAVPAGLSQREAADRRRRGEGNVAVRPVFPTVLPALVIWFALLTAPYRFRVLDRVLALDSLTRSRAPER